MMAHGKLALEAQIHQRWRGAGDPHGSWADLFRNGQAAPSLGDGIRPYSDLE